MMMYTAAAPPFFRDVYVLDQLRIHDIGFSAKLPYLADIVAHILYAEINVFRFYHIIKLQLPIVRRKIGVEQIRKLIRRVLLVEFFHGLRCRTVFMFLFTAFPACREYMTPSVIPGFIHYVYVRHNFHFPRLRLAAVCLDLVFAPKAEEKPGSASF
ncbi:hypothetical protein SDC9_161349 [bioreactor metagenome]|uniref:Uncharacterized protein n=1 Tax=bioreactor metagenome TaxID=1076179 RepID=A0A645FPA5_9ZZZZ